MWNYRNFYILLLKSVKWQYWEWGCADSLASYCLEKFSVNFLLTWERLGLAVRREDCPLSHILTLHGAVALCWVFCCFYNFYFPSHYDTCSNITPTAPYISSAFNQMCPNCVLFLLHIRIFNKVFRYSLYGNIITKSTASYIKDHFYFHHLF